MNDHKECEMLAIKIISSDISEAILLDIPVFEILGSFTPAKTGQKFTVNLLPFRDEAERKMDEAIRDYEILDEAIDAFEMEIERREANINSIVALCLTGK